MPINPTVSEWLNLIFRWVHVFAGIMWVGTTYYFTWLDARLSEEENGASVAPKGNLLALVRGAGAAALSAWVLRFFANIYGGPGFGSSLIMILSSVVFTIVAFQSSGKSAQTKETTGEPAQIWMVHSGGFYVVEKRKVPDILSRTLHWFRWEAATTWLSGVALLALMFYIGGGSGLLEGNADDISGRAAIAVGVGLLFVGWIVYDLMMISPLGRNEKAFAVIAYILIVSVAYGLTRVLSGRAAYIHIGAMFGTIMAANVWMRILPAQKKMIAAIKEGRQPDQALAAQAKLRSKQNTFMAVPVVFLMISNHFPGVTYGEPYNWSILAVLILVGWVAAKFIRRA